MQSKKKIYSKARIRRVRERKRERNRERDGYEGLDIQRGQATGGYVTQFSGPKKKKTNKNKQTNKKSLLFSDVRPKNRLITFVLVEEELVERKKKKNYGKTIKGNS